MIAVVVPVKGTERKSRLAGIMGEGQRRKLSQLLLLDLLDVLKLSRLIGSTYVVSSGRDILRIASSRGAVAIAEERDMGVNKAVTVAVDRLKGSTDFIVLPSDLPLLSPAAVRRALDLRKSGFEAVLAPSLSFNGTNLLLLNRDRQIPLSYDSNSFWNHLSLAAGRSFRVAVLTDMGLMLDLDTEEDARMVANTRINRRSVVYLRNVLK